MTTRPLRQGQRLWTFTERLHIPVPLPLKAHVLGLARESNVSVAAWGYGIVMTAVKNPEWLAEAMAKLHELQAAARSSHCYGVTPPQSAPSVTPQPGTRSP